MKKTKELVIEEYRNKYFLIEQDNFYQILNALVRNANPEDDSVDKYFTYRNELIKQLEDDHRWRYTSIGFINRSNFKYNPLEREITYRTNIIRKTNNGYSVDETSTPKAIEYFKRNENLFIELFKVERIINNIYYHYKVEVDRAMYLTKDRKTMKDINPKIRNKTKLQISSPIHKRQEGVIRGEIDDIYKFIRTYQKDGLKRLIRWLNTLNGIEDLDTIYTNYIEEMSPFAFIPERDDTQDKHKMAIATYHTRLLKMIKKYSIRGKSLSDKHNLSDINNKKLTSI